MGLAPTEAPGAAGMAAGEPANPSISTNPFEDPSYQFGNVLEQLGNTGGGDGSPKTGGGGSQNCCPNTFTPNVQEAMKQWNKIGQYGTIKYRTVEEFYKNHKPASGAVSPSYEIEGVLLPLARPIGWGLQSLSRLAKFVPSFVKTSKGVKIIAKGTQVTANTVKASTSKGINIAEDFISVFHKGNLNGGVVSTSRSLSTGLERTLVEGLKRPGKLWEFKIPRSLLEKWKFEGSVQTLQDLDIVTGIINQELRFSPKLASQLNQFLVK